MNRTVTVLAMWRRRARAAEWLESWPALAPAQLRHWALLDEYERARLSADVEWLVRTKHWEAARGFGLTQEIVLTVAAHAALLILGLDRRAYRDVRAIIVHPSTITQRGPRATTIPGVVADGPRRVLGHALSRRGPVVLAWDAVRRDLSDPNRGQNVVLHEMAHKIDAVDGHFDGTPEISGRTRQSEWFRVCTEELQRLRRRSEPDSVLRPYAAQSPSEFFAVATEAFFEQPIELAEHHRALYEVFRAHYRQDPAARLARVAGDAR